MDLAAAGGLSLVPFLLAASCSNLGAAIVDRLMLSRWRWSVTRSRKVVNLAGQLGPCAALITLALTAPPPQGTASIIMAVDNSTSDSGGGESNGLGGGPSAVLAGGSVASQPVSMPVSPGPLPSALLAAMSIAMGALTQAGCWSNIMDVAPRHVSVVLGIANTIATFPGIACNLLTGGMLAGGWGWGAVFALGACMEIIGAAVYARMASGEDQGF